MLLMFVFFSSRRRHTRSKRDWSSDVCSSDLELETCKKTTLKKFDISDKEFTEIVEKMANYKKGTENIKYVN